MSEIERAIDAVEEALAGVKPLHAARVVVPGGASQSRGEVAAQFERLALAAQGLSCALAGLPQGREEFARLLVLRECMHHLDIASIVAAAEHRAGDRNR